MQTVDTLVHAAHVIPVQPAGVLRDHAVAIEAGRIVAVVPAAEAATRFQARTRVDLPRHALIPGLVNLHCHCAMSLMRGLADDMPLMSWLSEHVWPAEGRHVSDEFVHASWITAVAASPKAIHDCVGTWPTDFRADLAKFDLPTLVVHGDADRIVPLDVSGRRTAEAVKGAKLVVLEGAPHGLNWTHAEELNRALLEFLGAPAMAEAR